MSFVGQCNAQPNKIKIYNKSSKAYWVHMN